MRLFLLVIVFFAFGCSSGTSSGPSDGGAEEASQDASPEASQDAGAFACGAETCGPGKFCATHHCGIPTDAGDCPPASGCEDAPLACQGNLTCACLRQASSTTCEINKCSESNGRVFADCLGL